MKIKEINSYIFAEKENLSLEYRLFLSSIIIGILTSLFGSLINLFVATSVIAAVIPLFLTALLCILYYFIRFKKIIKPFIVPMIIIAMIGISVIWVFNGGINGSNSITALVILILALVVVPDKVKSYVLALFVSLNIILYLIQFYRPDLITKFPTETERWIDSIITLTYVSFFIYLIMKFLHKNYRFEKQRAEESEKRYRAYVETANEGILVAQGANLKYVNPMISEIIGYSEKELLSIPFIEFVHPDDRELMIKNYRKRLKDDVIESRYPIRILTKHKGEVWVEMSGVKIDWEGNPATLNFIYDITERKKAEYSLKESEVQYRSIANNGNALIWISSIDKLCNYFNEPWLNFTGRTLEQEMGNGWAEGVHSDDFDECLRIYTTAFDKQEKFDMDYRLKHVSGEYRWIKDLGTPNYNSAGEFIGYIGHCFDITERKLADAEIQRKNAELAELNASKDKFFSIIAHDLRNPLGNFKLITKLLHEDFDDLSNEERIELLESMKDSADNIYSLLENLLEWSQTQRNKIQFNPVELNLKLLSVGIINLLKPTAEKKQIQLINNISISSEVYADVNMINTVLRNLLSNAIKFTPNGGKIEIGIIKSSDDLMTSDDCIYVKDEGIGMSQDTIQKLFKIDENISTLGTNNEKGTGLGLILCKEFVEKHGGRIWVESEECKGSTFYFSLPKVN
jgi:PAS domain S-box-containing protein